MSKKVREQMSNRIKGEKPKPCPFCGSTELKLQYTMVHNEKIHYVNCRKCGANGGLAIRADFALRMWNNRVKAESEEK